MNPIAYSEEASIYILPYPTLHINAWPECQQGMSYQSYPAMSRNTTITLPYRKQEMRYLIIIHSLSSKVSFQSTTFL